MSSPLIRYQDVLRDAGQSLWGTNMSTLEILDAYRHAHLTGVSAIQTGGGTFLDLFARKGRKEWDEAERLIVHFKRHNVWQSALVRGDFLVGYEPQPFDVIKAFVREYARMGMNELQNFHGLNYTPAMAGVPEAARQVREEEGLDIHARGTIAVETNSNITIDSCLRTAQALVDLGHEGFYLKSASGVLEADFVYALTEKLLAEFDQDIGIHVHSTYGKAPVCYMAAIEAAVERGRSMTIDVQHPALSGLTAHPSIFKMQQIIKAHPNPAVRDNAPAIDAPAIRADMDSLHALRFRYRKYESSYNNALLMAMKDARAPGGASSTLLGISGLKENLARVLGTDDWDAIQIKIYEMQKNILPAIGDPTQVTPYAANTTGQAGLSLFNSLRGNDPFETLYGGLMNYLVGRHGQVPDTVDPALVEKALKQAKLDKPVTYVLAQDKKPVMDTLKQQLRDAGIADPTDRQAISLAIAEASGVAARIQHIVACSTNKNVPQPMPDMPDYARPATPGGDFRGGRKFKSHGPEHVVAAIGGVAKLQWLAELAAHVKQIDDDWYEFPHGEGDLKAKWHAGAVRKASEFLESVPVLLKAAGFKSFQTKDQHFADIPLKAEFWLHTFDTILRDACDAKGKGLYDHLTKAIEVYRRGPTYVACPLIRPAEDVSERPALHA
jgi:pyruvate/oxaloacetate carboxyltransferase